MKENNTNLSPIHIGIIKILIVNDTLQAQDVHIFLFQFK